MAFYPHSTASFLEMIKNKFPFAETKEYDLAQLNLDRIRFDWNLQLMFCEDLLWMLDKVEKMGPEERGKAGRWIGWIAGYMEVMGFLTNAQTREIVRVDKESGNE